MSRQTACNSFEKAIRVAALPWNHSQSDFVSLIQRGYGVYSDREESRSLMLRDVERFTTLAFDYEAGDVRETPPIDDPGTLTILATLGVECIRTHENLGGTPLGNLALVEDVQTLFVDTLIDILRTETESDRSIPQDIAEHVFGRDFAEYPYPGRICTGVKPVPELGGGLFVEIPMVAASPQCLFDADDTDANRAFTTRLHDNHLYIPERELRDRYHDVFDDEFERLVTTQRNCLTDDQREWLFQNESTITEQIDVYFETNHVGRVWTDWSQTDRRLEAMINAVEAAPDSVAQLGAYQPATALMQAIVEYSPKERWEETVLDRIHGPQGVANMLCDCSGRSNLEIDGEGKTNEYKLQRYVGNAKQITVEDTEDLFELPCFGNLRERLHEKKPVRKDLFSLARLVMWLPHHQPDPSLDDVLDDLHDLFSEWPWYDPAETEYQVKYEFWHGTAPDGNPYLPVRCDSDVMQRYCIGQRDCEYSIYGSVPFPDEMYALLDSKQ